MSKQFADLGDVVTFSMLGKELTGIIVDGGCATWLDHSVAVHGYDDLFHLTSQEVQYVRPSYVSEAALYDDEPGGVIHKHLQQVSSS